MGRRKTATTTTKNSSGATVGYEASRDDGGPVDETMQRLTAGRRKPVTEARRPEAAIEEDLTSLGWRRFES